jgi:hypothetical protein
VGSVACSPCGRPGVRPEYGTPTVVRGNRKVLEKDRHGCLRLMNNPDDRFGDSEEECNPCPDVTDVVDPEADEVCEPMPECDPPGSSSSSTSSSNQLGAMLSAAAPVVRATGDSLGDISRAASAYAGVGDSGGGKGRCGDRCYPEIDPVPDMPRQHCQQVTRVAPTRVTVCASLQGPRLDPYPAVPRPYRQLYSNAFGSFAAGLAACSTRNVDYFYFSDSERDFVANDGSIHINPKKGLILDASSFSVTYSPADQGDEVTFSAAGYLDRFKLWLNHPSQHPYPHWCGQLRYEVCMAAATTNTNPNLAKGPYQPPAAYDTTAGFITDPESDPRVACSGPTFTTSDNYQIMFGITSGATYAIWQYLPFERESSTTTTGALRASFVGAKYVKRNNAAAPLSKVHKYGLAFDKHKRTAHWYIDDVEVHQVGDLGTPPNPDHSMVLLNGDQATPSHDFARHGFGHFTFVDAQAAEQSTVTGRNYALARLVSDSYFFPLIPTPGRLEPGFAVSDTTLPRGARIYGQGARAEIQEVNVYWAR